MRLSRVVISGFKTFARRSEVILDDRITAVVGPNGSGKSNFVDAIRWALGETNARELRGARMDEVIYAGGGGRGRLGLAEVELVLDNADGRLGREDAEISVSRRVARDGDSEFRLNGDRVRLRDLERVLAPTGLTQSGYAVVAQHDIDSIIQANPQQRRSLVEQAAGVRTLKAASDDALERVGRAEITLRRLEDFLAEAEPRLTELIIQAAVAAEQRELSARLVELRGSLAREEWRAARGRLKQARRRLDTAVSRAEAATEAEAGFTSGYEEQRHLVAEGRREQREAGARLEAARLAAERAAGEARRWSDRLTLGAVQRSQAATQLAAAVEELDRARAAAAELTAARAGPEPTDAGTGEAPAAYGAEFASATSAGRPSADTPEPMAAGIPKDAAATGAGSAGRGPVPGPEATATEPIDPAVAQRLEAARRLHDGAVARLAESGRLRSEGESAAATTAAARAAAIAARREAVSRLTVLDEAIAALERDIQEFQGRIETALAGGSDPSAGVARAIGAGHLTGRRLRACFTVIDPADAVAVEAALEHHLDGWVVEDLTAAMARLDPRGAREQLISGGIDPPAAAPWATGAPAKARSVLDAIQITEPQARGALSRLLASTWMVQSMDQALPLVSPGEDPPSPAGTLPDAPITAAATERRHDRAPAPADTAVLPDGTVVTACSIRGGGRPGRDRALAAEPDRGRLAAAETALQARRETRTAAVAAAETAEAAWAVAERAFHEAQQRLEALRLARAECRIETDTAATALREAETEVSRARLKAEAEASRARMLAEAEASRVRMLAEAEASRIRMLAEDRRRRLDAAHRATEIAETRAAAVELRLMAIEAEVIAALARGRRAQEAVTRAGDQVWTATGAMERAAPTLADAERALAALEAERAEVAVARARAADECSAARSEVAATEAVVARLAEAVRDDGGGDGPEPDAQAAERAEREILRLERRIAALGPVNALAPEQLKGLSTRVGTVRGNRDDLGGACADIRALGRHLGDQSERRFDTVFGEVSHHFQELFEELFPSGRATLRLEHPSELSRVSGNSADSSAHVATGAVPVDPGSVPVTSGSAPVAPGAPTNGARAPSGIQAARLPGVEILAQPPGKRLQPLSLLSGGERALTALAVILALQQVNPSPFYVFDEVDAALDDSNVTRLTRLLQRLCRRQQFIVVTHNHITMAAADALYGVTIDGGGASSILSARLATEDGDAGARIVGVTGTAPANRAGGPAQTFTGAPATAPAAAGNPSATVTERPRQMATAAEAEG